MDSLLPFLPLEMIESAPASDDCLGESSERVRVVACCRPGAFNQHGCWFVSTLLC